VFVGSVNAATTVTGITPSSGTANGGTTVVITGAGFIAGTGVSAVKVGGTAVTSYVVISDTQISAVTAAHGTGAVSVDVTANASTNAANTLYTYTSANVNVQVSVKVTIAKRADIQWGAATTVDDAGNARANTILPYTWIVKDAEYGALNQINPGAVYLTTDPTYPHTLTVSNQSKTNSTINISAQCTNAINLAAAPPTGTTWNGAGAPNTDVFEMRASLGAGALTVISPGPGSLTGAAGGAVLSKGAGLDQALVLEFSSPTSISSSTVAGQTQTITVSLIATAN
jgi:hypothetical protein